MARKLYVGGLPYRINDTDLQELFQACGEVESAQVITDKFTGKSKGFGFVTMATEEDAQKAVQEMNGKEVDGRTLVVNEARPEQPRGFSRGGGFGGGGSRDRGSRGGGDRRGGGRKQERW